MTIPNKMVELNREQETDFILPKWAFSRRQETSVSCSYAERSPFYLKEIMPFQKRNILWKKSLGLTRFSKNCIPWNKGKKGIYSKESLKKMSESHLNKHNSVISEFKKGQTKEKAGYWKGGRIKYNYGYILIYKPEHPFANGKYVLEHRLVVEKQIGRYLKPKEVVHHRGIEYFINSIENKQDNCPRNLMAFINASAHTRFELNRGKSVRPEEIIFDGRIYDKV